MKTRRNQRKAAVVKQEVNDEESTAVTDKPKRGRPSKATKKGKQTGVSKIPIPSKKTPSTSSVDPDVETAAPKPRGRKAKKDSSENVLASGDSGKSRGKKRLVVHCEVMDNPDAKKPKIDPVESPEEVEVSPSEPQDVGSISLGRARRGTYAVVKSVQEEDRRGTFTLNEAPTAAKDRRGTYFVSKSPQKVDRRGTFVMSKGPNFADRRGTFTVAKMEAMSVSEGDEDTIEEEPTDVEPTDVEPTDEEKDQNNNVKPSKLPSNSRAKKATAKKNEKPKVSVIKEENENTSPTRDESGSPEPKKGQPSTSKKSKKKSDQPWDEDIIDLVLKESKLKKVHTKGEKFVGGHVSIAGGLWNAVHEAVHLGARSFAMFLKPQRTWNCKPLTDEDAERFKHTLKTYGFSPSMVVPHGSYLMNCGAPKADILAKSRVMLVDELQRCDRLGIDIFNFHPGSTCGLISIEECLERIADSINNALSQSLSVTAVIENMSCQGHTVGGKFSELRQIIDLVTDKSRVGICLDTCHAFAAGYDLHTKSGYNHMMTELEEIVGLQYLKAVHINDSKGAVGCHLDRHELIGKGHIGQEGFERIMNDPRFDNIPLILETPEDDYSVEIKLLNTMIQ